MTEKDIIVKFEESALNRSWVFWKAPWFQRLRWDIFGVWDIIVANSAKMSSYPPLFFVQLTTKNHLSHRRRKIQNWRELSGVERSVLPGYIFAWDTEHDCWVIEQC